MLIHSTADFVIYGCDPAAPCQSDHEVSDGRDTDVFPVGAQMF